MVEVAAGRERKEIVKLSENNFMGSFKTRVKTGIVS